MKVYKGLEQYEGIENPIITTGTFDGVHLAHQKIISRIKEIARDANGESMLITYSPHPRLVLGSNEKELKLINTLDEKIQWYQFCPPQTDHEHMKFYLPGRGGFVRRITVRKTH